MELTAIVMEGFKPNQCYAPLESSIFKRARILQLVFSWPTPNKDSLTCQKKSHKERDRFEISTTKSLS
eukprot:5806406-Ditylum_brightwellii.AAC.1